MEKLKFYLICVLILTVVSCTAMPDSDDFKFEVCIGIETDDHTD